MPAVHRLALYILAEFLSDRTYRMNHWWFITHTNGEMKYDCTG